MARIHPFAAAALAILASVAACGCAGTAPERDARGNPRIDRLPGDALPRVAPAARLTAQDLVRLSREGLAPQAIVARIRESGSRFDLSASRLLELDRQGVDAAVLDYIVEAERRAKEADLADALVKKEAAEARSRAELERRREARPYYRYYDPFWQYDPFWPGPYLYWGWGSGYRIR